jgi:hypothetical protein
MPFGSAFLRKPIMVTGCRHLRYDNLIKVELPGMKLEIDVYVTEDT